MMPSAIPRAAESPPVRGFIPADRQLTNVPHILAVGDIVGQPMLATGRRTTARSQPRRLPECHVPASSCFISASPASVVTTKDRSASIIVSSFIFLPSRGPTLPALPCQWKNVPRGGTFAGRSDPPPPPPPLIDF